MSKEKFLGLVSEIATSIQNLALGPDMELQLNRDYAANSTGFATLKALCAQGEQEGWLMSREAGGIRYGRAVKPGQEAGRFSVDVVRMKDVKGPHHIHTNGEIGAIMALDGNPRFDGHAEGWYVYPAGSRHHPTVTDGEAYVLYLLPEGAIEFTAA
jgi:hypothetical protein